MVVVIDVDHAADSEAGEIVGGPEGGVEMVAADIDEIAVDAGLTKRSARSRNSVQHRPGLVNDGSNSAQYLATGASFCAARPTSTDTLARFVYLHARRSPHPSGGRADNGG